MMFGVTWRRPCGWNNKDQGRWSWSFIQWSKWAFVELVTVCHLCHLVYIWGISHTMHFTFLKWISDCPFLQLPLQLGHSHVVSSNNQRPLPPLPSAMFLQKREKCGHGCHVEPILWCVWCQWLSGASLVEILVCSAQQGKGELGSCVRDDVREGFVGRV